MKLNEIYDIEHKPQIDDEEAGEYISSGMYASVNKHKKDPHMVIKHTRQADPYNKYVEALVQSQKWKENPHFPRIYVRGTQDHSYTMEKLIPFGDLELDELENYFKNHFDAEYNTHQLDKHDITYTMADMFRSRIPEHISDELLKEAIEWLRELSNQLDVHLDLHNNNFMWRRGPYGIQLVFTDPFSEL